MSAFFVGAAIRQSIIRHLHSNRPPLEILTNSSWQAIRKSHRISARGSLRLPRSGQPSGHSALDKRCESCYALRMGDFLNQLPAILGVMIGALGTLLVTSLTDRARWKRDQAIRWDTRRLDAYVTYAASVKEIHALALRVSAPHRLHSKSRPLAREQGLEMFAEANARRTKAGEAMLLLGDEETVKAARAWQDAVGAEEHLSTDDSIDERGWRSAVEAVDQARDRFYVAARENLGVHGGSVAQSSFLRARARPIS